MREQDLLSIMARATYLLRRVGQLEETEELAMLKGSWSEGVPWGVTVLITDGEETRRESGHPALNIVGWAGVLGNSKREMGEALEHTNRVLLAWAESTGQLEESDG